MEKNTQSPLPLVTEAPLPPASCATCPFWYRVNDSSGKCRRFPPTISDPKQITSYGPTLVHGLTPTEEVCGEHPHFKK